MAVGAGGLPDFLSISGIRLGVAEAGIKKPGRKDLVLIELAKGGSCAGVFTKNAFCAAPVILSKKHLLEACFASKSNGYLLVNTGNANAGTGKAGMDDALLSCQSVAAQFNVLPEQVLPFSTGVIGEKLPIAKIQKGIPLAAADLSEGNWASAAEGILTTDTRPKGVSTQVTYGGQLITINGISKGSGMIRPNMATMLGFIGTDATISESLLAELTTELAEHSFNRITVDGDTSTNDSCMLLASGQSAAPEIRIEHEDFLNFNTALQDVFIELAQ